MKFIIVEVPGRYTQLTPTTHSFNVVPGITYFTLDISGSSVCLHFEGAANVSDFATSWSVFFKDVEAVYDTYKFTKR